MYRRMPHSTSPSSMIELTDFSNRDSSLGGSTVSLNLQIPETTERRMPRGAHIGDPIQFPSLRSAFSRLSGLLTGHSTVQKKDEDSINLASRVVAADDESTMRLAGSTATKKLVEGVKRSGKKLPPIDLPWPMGRPEYSQVTFNNQTSNLKTLMLVVPESLVFCFFITQTQRKISYVIILRNLPELLLCECLV